MWFHDIITPGRSQMVGVLKRIYLHFRLMALTSAWSIVKCGIVLDFCKPLSNLRCLERRLLNLRRSILSLYYLIYYIILFNLMLLHVVPPCIQHLDPALPHAGPRRGRNSWTGYCWHGWWANHCWREGPKTCMHSCDMWPNTILT